MHPHAGTRAESPGLSKDWRSWDLSWTLSGRGEGQRGEGRSILGHSFDSHY